MPIALLHDYLDQRGGAERVVLSMLKAFPDAQLITSIFSPARTWPEFGSYDVRQICSPAEQRLVARIGGRAMAPLIARRWASFTCEARYDRLVASSSGFAHWAGSASGAALSWYCYTPPRWLYKPDQYFQDRTWQRTLTAAKRKRWLTLDQTAGARASRIAGISSQVVADVQQVYRRPAALMAPPIRMPSFATSHDRERWALTVGRLIPYKNIDVAVRASAHARVPLKVVGMGPMLPALQKLAQDLDAPVEFLGHVSEQKLVELYRRAGVLLQPGAEDFGLTPLEAASQQCPSVCLASGGAIDTVIPGVTGRLVDSLETHEWADAIVAALADRSAGEAAEQHAQQYAESSWIERFTQWAAP